MNSEFLEQVLEKLSPSSCLENLIDRLEGDLFGEFCIGIGIANPADLGSSDNAEKIEVVEGTGGLGKTSHQVRTQRAFGKVHVEDGREPVGSVPGCGSDRHGDGNRTGARDLRIVDEGRATLAVSIEQAGTLAIGPDAEHPVSLPPRRGPLASDGRG